MAGAAERPNIVFIFTDDHACQSIGAYGSTINKTPNIDRIAREGAIFTNSFCANSICGPSRACVLTGKHSHKNGFYSNGRNKFDGGQFTFPPLESEIAGWSLLTAVQASAGHMAVPLPASQGVGERSGDTGD